MRNVKAIVAGVAVALTLCAGAPAALAQGYGDKSSASAAKADIVDVAVGAGQFGTLAKALSAAGLVDTLKGPGPFTVFAPNDAAFAKLPPGKLDALLADKAALTKVLTYHVVPGRIVAADVKSGSLKSLQGQQLRVTASSAGVSLNEAKVLKTDVMASNGVIHVIDTVVLPN
jgi:uncharacterized surface protein with fasciclin (FAS1) repeats